MASKISRCIVFAYVFVLVLLTFDPTAFAEPTRAICDQFMAVQQSDIVTVDEVEAAVEELFGRLPTSEDVASLESFADWVQPGVDCFLEDYSFLSEFARCYQHEGNMEEARVLWTAAGWIEAGEFWKIEGIPSRDSRAWQKAWSYFIQAGNLTLVNKAGAVVCDIMVNQFLVDPGCHCYEPAYQCSGECLPYSPVHLQQLMKWAKMVGRFKIVKNKLTKRIDWHRAMLVRTYEDVETIATILNYDGELPPPWCK